MALKSRHPLEDVVEASGVQLRGRGRVRQGVCPFHQESEGSFTVYGDTERWYCFGCGQGRDVRDFMQGVEGLKPARGDTEAGRWVRADAQSRSCSQGTGRSSSS